MSAAPPAPEVVSALAAALSSAGTFQARVTLERPVQFAATLVGFAFVAVVAAGAAALVYRWYTREPISEGVPALFAVSAVGVSLQTMALLGRVASDEVTGLFALPVVFANLVSLGVALAVAPVGRRLGDRLATDVFALTGAREFEGDVGRLVRSVGRVTVVSLPEEIDDMDAYDPVADRVKEELAGRTLLFPTRLTEADLREHFVRRLKEDYAVGYVDVEFDDGDVAYLALGSRVAGLGPTLAHGTVAVAVRADPPNAGSPGDVVQVWTAGDGDATPSRVTTAELRAAVDDVVTLAVDESDARKLRPDREYRLLTMPVAVTPDREFATLLRAADETMGTVTVAAGSALDGATVADLDDTTVIAVRPGGATVDPLPRGTRTFSAGETVYAVARPEVLRRLEDAAAEPGSESDPTSGSGSATFLPGGEGAE